MGSEDSAEPASSAEAEGEQEPASRPYMCYQTTPGQAILAPQEYLTGAKQRLENATRKHRLLI